MEFGEWLCEEVLKAVPHRHFTLSLPKILRRYFLYDRRLLSDLSRCAWDSLETVLLPIVRDPDASPGAVIAIQTFGDFLNFNPHCHVLCTDGVFYRGGWFKVAPALDTAALEKVFQHKVFGMLLRKGKIAEEVAKLILSWRHSGFNVHCGPRIQPENEEAMENIARYIIRASFSQERMTYLPDESQVLYRSKDGKNEKTFDALEWLAAMCSHVPNKGEQMVTRKILKHLGLWHIKPRPPPLMPKAQMLSTEPHIDYSDSQVPPSDNALYVDPVSPADLAA